MNISHSHMHKLRFFIDNDAPNKYMKRWKKLKTQCENGKNKQLVKLIRENCKLNKNRNLQYLNNFEGGMCNENKNKRIRFRNNKSISKLADNEIILDQILDIETEKWTYEELDDLIYGFVKMSNYIIKADCVNGSIEMIIFFYLEDNYLDTGSDSDNDIIGRF